MILNFLKGCGFAIISLFILLAGVLGIIEDL